MPRRARVAALSADSLKSAFGSAVDTTFGTASTVAETATSVAKDASEAAEIVVKATKPAVDAAAPVVSKAASAAAEKGVPAAGEALSAARSALVEAGAPVEDVTAALNKGLTAGSDVVTKATPVVKSTADSLLTFLTTTSPDTLAAGAAAAVGAYYLLPPVLGALATLTRGYAGELRATDLLDLLINKKCVVVDIRSDAVRVSAGEPDLPGPARGKLLHWPVQKISRKERGQVSDPDGIEAETTGLQIANLKRLKKGNTVVIMDEGNSRVAGIIARRLAKEGYGNTYILKGGFGEWKRASLKTREVTKVFVEAVAAPQLTISGKGPRGFLE